jgi:hypothetical protein
MINRGGPYRPTGLAAIEEFLMSLEPELRAVEAEVAVMNQWLDVTPDPIARLPLIGIGWDWFRLREADRHRMQRRATEALDMIATYRTLLARRPGRSLTRRVDRPYREALRRLEEARAKLLDFTSGVAKAEAWIRDVLPAACPQLAGGIGCSRILVPLVLPPPGDVLVYVATPAS